MGKTFQKGRKTMRSLSLPTAVLKYPDVFPPSFSEEIGYFDPYVGRKKIYQDEVFLSSSREKAVAAVIVLLCPPLRWENSG